MVRESAERLTLLHWCNAPDRPTLRCMAATTAPEAPATDATRPTWLAIFDARARELGDETEQQIADRMGVDRTMRWRYERGAMPKPGKMREIAAGIDMSATVLFAAELGLRP